jgi:hypothetical protein
VRVGGRIDEDKEAERELQGEVMKSEDMIQIYGNDLVEGNEHAYQSAREIDPCSAGVGAIEPGGYGEAEEATWVGHGGYVCETEEV